MTKRNIIVIGTSAGGVEALCELTKHLPEKLDASVLWSCTSAMKAYWPKF